MNVVGLGIARICRGPDMYSHDILARARLWRPGCNLDDFFASVEAADVVYIDFDKF